MLGLHPKLRVFVSKDSVDMRCGRCRLAAKVKDDQLGDPSQVYLCHNRYDFLTALVII
jgi:hypothetical protein